jgi:hypothetical protein
VLWRDLDCAPHPGQKFGCRLSTVTVQACSRRSTLTTFKPAAGDHVIDVFIAPCCRMPSQGASRPASSRASHPASLAPRVNQTPVRWSPTLNVRFWDRPMSGGAGEVGRYWPFANPFRSVRYCALPVAPGLSFELPQSARGGIGVLQSYIRFAEAARPH